MPLLEPGIRFSVTLLHLQLRRQLGSVRCGNLELGSSRVSVLWLYTEVILSNPPSPVLLCCLEGLVRVSAAWRTQHLAELYSTLQAHTAQCRGVSVWSCLNDAWVYFKCSHLNPPRSTSGIWNCFLKYLLLCHREGTAKLNALVIVERWVGMATEAVRTSDNCTLLASGPVVVRTSGWQLQRPNSSLAAQHRLICV